VKETAITDKLRRWFCNIFYHPNYHHKELRLVSLGGGETDTVGITILKYGELVYVIIHANNIFHQNKKGINKRS